MMDGIIKWWARRLLWFHGYCPEHLCRRTLDLSLFWTYCPECWDRGWRHRMARNQVREKIRDVKIERLKARLRK
jgi:hypothetical protein